MVFPVSYIVLMFHVANRTNVLGVKRGVSLAASFRLSLHCIISLRDGDPSFPRGVFWFVVVDAFVTSLFMGRVVCPTLTPLSSRRVGPALVATYDMHGRAVGLFYTQPTRHTHTHTYTHKLLTFVPWLTYISFNLFYWCQQIWLLWVHSRLLETLFYEWPVVTEFWKQVQERI